MEKHTEYCDGECAMGRSYLRVGALEARPTWFMAVRNNAGNMANVVFGDGALCPFCHRELCAAPPPLRPCPSCGSAFIVRIQQDKYSGALFVRCQKCGTRGPNIDADGEKWNAMPRREDFVAVDTTRDAATGAEVTLYARREDA